MSNVDPIDLLKVHHTSVLEDGSEKLVRVTPYLCITVGHNPKLFLKNGRVYDAGGREVKDTPPGFWGAVAKCSEKALKECGFTPDDVQNLDTQEDKPPTPVASPAPSVASSKRR